MSAVPGRHRDAIRPHHGCCWCKQPGWLLCLAALYSHYKRSKVAHGSWHSVRSKAKLAAAMLLPAHAQSTRCISYLRADTCIPWTPWADDQRLLQGCLAWPSSPAAAAGRAGVRRRQRTCCCSAACQAWCICPGMWCPAAGQPAPAPGAPKASLMWTSEGSCCVLACKPSHYHQQTGKGPAADVA